MIKTERDTVDLTELKAHLYQENINNLNPTLFKKINDLALTSNFEGELSKDAFIRFFMADDLFSNNSPPSLYDMVEIQ